jgi:hypothetical protein
VKEYSGFTPGGSKNLYPVFLIKWKLYRRFLNKLAISSGLAIARGFFLGYIAGALT